MRRQTHKEYLEILKETDPITYHEMTKGTNGDNFGCVTLFIVLVIAVLFTLFFFFGGKY